MTIQELIAAAKCFDECIPPGLHAALQTYLLNQISGNVLAGGVSCGAGDPSGSPAGTCGVYFNTTDDSFWAWNGTTWVELIA